MLLYPGGKEFAIGESSFSLIPVRDSDESNRIVIQVDLDGQRIRGYVDTGAVYFICHPDIVPYLNIDSDDVYENRRLRIHGLKMEGGIARLPLTLLAEKGKSILIDVTAFIPSKDQGWEGLPKYSILGYYNCLDRIRIAIDPGVAEVNPNSGKFFFGGV